MPQLHRRSLRGLAIGDAIGNNIGFCCSSPHGVDEAVALAGPLLKSPVNAPPLSLLLVGLVSLLVVFGCTFPCAAKDAPAPFCRSERLMLSGTGRDDAVAWEFFCTGGRRSGEWSTIPVPSHWELQGFGSFNYGHDVPKADEEGRYRRTFVVPARWAGQVVRLVFEGVMTDTEVRVNGQLAGPVHQGGFFRFSYDITEFVRYDEENLLEVLVSKVSSNDRIEQAERKADYWVFGGIYRPVYLLALPRDHIEWVELDARADGGFSLVAHLDGEVTSSRVTARILTLDGAAVGEEATAIAEDGRARIATRVGNPRLWTAETPNLYQVKVGLRKEGALVHEEVYRFGFRTFEVRPGSGLFLNGQPIVLKGVNRHSFRPDSGRCLSPAISREDVLLIKSMNMNAVRMSHYPPDPHFLDACDELGLYVMDELPGWQKPPYDTSTARRLVGQMVRRDQNHPSILFWNNGNEGGWNREVDGDFRLYDLQDRVVLHPWERFGGIDTDHYPTYTELVAKVAAGHLFMPTEFLHGLYDGGHGAGLRDYWQVMRSTPLGVGGFLWVFADEGVLRNDKGGVHDTDGNHAPDGIVGPNHEKEGSYYSIRQIWSPVQIGCVAALADLAGPFAVENHYDFTDLNTCRFTWQLMRCDSPLMPSPGMNLVASGSLPGPTVAPGASGQIHLDLPAGWLDNDVLRLRAFDGSGCELRSWTWSLRDPAMIESPVAAVGMLNVIQRADAVVVEAGTERFVFDRASGRLKSVHRGDERISLANGPRIVHGEPGTGGQRANTGAETRLNVSESTDQVEIRVLDPGRGLSALTWTVDASGALSLDCTYACDGEYDFHGITFDCPEGRVRSKQWLGDGPFRVWKNRRDGPLFGIWSTPYQNHVPGQSFDYPEFSGYFANMHWLSLVTDEGRLLVMTDTPGLFVRVYAPEDGADPKNTRLPTFEGDLSFLHAIPAIGTKFHAARKLGPQGARTRARGAHEISLQFRFE